MKRYHHFILFLLFLCSFSFLEAQVPHGFRYQAVVRDGDGGIMKNAVLQVRLSLLQGTAEGAQVWSETVQATTNALGLMALEAGGTVPVDVDWSAGPYFLKVEVDLQDGQGFREIGKSEILAVPYALYAEEVKNRDDADADPQNEIQDLQLNGNRLTITRNGSATVIDLTPYLDNPGWEKSGEDTLVYEGSVVVGTSAAGGSKMVVRGDDVASEEPLFEVKRKDGQTVFAVYNSGVRIYVDTAAAGKGPYRSGFAIGGFGMTKGAGQEYLRVTPDSVRIYINDTDAKNPRGGFAIGGYNFGKGITHEYLRVTDDSTRVYVNTSQKGPRGGFAIGGLDFLKGGSVNNFLDLTPENYLIGHESGKKLTAGMYNSFIGYQAGINTTTGKSNIFLGYQSGTANESGSRNVYLGEQAGAAGKDANNNIALGYFAGNKNTGDDNIFLGTTAGSEHLDGGTNIMIGNESGRYLDYGVQNIMIGYRSGFASAGDMSNANQNVFIGDYIAFWLTTGSQNTSLGGFSASNLSTGSHNLLCGYETAYSLKTGSRNVFLGAFSGKKNVDGNGNVFIGYNAGFNETGSDKLYIENSDADSSSALVYGDFDKDILVFNGKVGIGTAVPSERMTVDGNLSFIPGANRYVGLPDGLHTLVLGPSSATSEYPWAALLTAHGKVNIRIDDDAARGMNMDSKGFVGFGVSTPGYRIDLPNTADEGGRARANQWLTYSDGRIKKQQHPLDYGLAQVLSLRPVRYEQHASTFEGGNLKLHPEAMPTIGLVAQEVYEVVPEAVQRPEDEETALWSMDYQKLIPVMIKGMQEQQELIEKLRQRIEQLEKEMETLRKRR